MQIVPDRHLIRIALNLYSISFKKMPTYGGEIDQIEKGVFVGNNLLLDFCKSFKDLFNNGNSDSFILLANKICDGKDERSLFFKKCCEIEVEYAKKHEAPLTFYWDDYYLFRKTNDFIEIIKKAYKISKHFLEQKPQYTIEQVKAFLNEIIKGGGFVFSNISKIILYGSLAKGTNKDYSDIDLLIVFKSNDPLNPLVVKVLIDKFKAVSRQLPDCNFIYSGQTNRFIDWINGYGVEVFCKDEK